MRPVFIAGFLVLASCAALAQTLEDKIAHSGKSSARIDRDIDSSAQTSGIVLNSLSSVQIENLATLCKVWGFLKYHHPAIVSGGRQFDFELFRISPAVLAASDRAVANAAMAKWVSGLGPVQPCKSCVQLGRSGLYLAPDLDWIRDTRLLGAGLSRTLLEICANRPDLQQQFYVRLAPGAGNPVFEHELGYPGIKLPNPGFQLLALFRYWNIVQYWYPYRDLIGSEWDHLLTEFIPRVALARDSNDYQLQMMQLIARVQDTHANLWSSLSLRPPAGDCAVPVQIRFVDNRPVVIQLFDSDLPLKVGDIIQQIDGTPVDKLMFKWAPYYADSNEAARLRDMASTMTQGDCLQPAALTELRDGTALRIAANRRPLFDAAFSGSRRHDRPGPAFQKLSGDIAYLKL